MFPFNNTIQCNIAKCVGHWMRTIWGLGDQPQWKLCESFGKERVHVHDYMCHFLNGYKIKNIFKKTLTCARLFHCKYNPLVCL